MACKALMCVAVSGRDVIGVPRWLGLRGVARAFALLPAAFVGAVLLYATAGAAEKSASVLEEQSEPLLVVGAARRADREDRLPTVHSEKARRRSRERRAR